MKSNAVFLDRDGTLIADVGYPHRPEHLQLLPGVPDGLRLLADLGRRLVLVTNQSGVARGYFSEADVKTFQNTLLRELAAHCVKLDAIYTCPFHPTEGVGPYRWESPLRKPAPGMLLQAAADLALDLPGGTNWTIYRGRFSSSRRASESFGPARRTACSRCFRASTI